MLGQKHNPDGIDWVTSCHGDLTAKELTEHDRIHSYGPNGHLQHDMTPYFDSKHQKMIMKVHPGHYSLIQNQAGLLSTVLGSCVSVCLFDPIHNIGGMNHFMAPDSESGLWSGKRSHARYGNHAMSQLIDALLAAGANYHNLIAKVFGATHSMMEITNVAFENERFIRHYFDQSDIDVSVLDLGGGKARTILFNPQTGQVWRRLLHITHSATPLS